MFNKIILVGHLTRNVEANVTAGGMTISKFGLATNSRYKTQSGETREDTCFIDITCFGRLAEIARDYLRKGSLTLVEGTLKYDTWNDASGQKRSKHYILADGFKMLDKRTGASSGEGFGENRFQQGSYGSERKTFGSSAQQQDDDDEVFFGAFSDKLEGPTNVAPPKQQHKSFDLDSKPPAVPKPAKETKKTPPSPPPPTIESNQEDDDDELPF